jgi:hypothetical protein
MQDASQRWQPSDLIQKKVLRQYRRKYGDPQPRRDNILARADGTLPSDCDHVQYLIAEARQAAEYAPDGYCCVLYRFWSLFVVWPP